MSKIMRIISQNEDIDLPYNKIGLSIVRFDNRFYIHWNSVNAKLSGIIAKYSTEAKAKEAMKMLRGACEYNYDYFKFPQEDMDIKNVLTREKKSTTTNHCEGDIG